MTTIIPTLAVATIVMAASAGGDLLETHQISLPTVFSVGAIVFIGGRKFQKIDDRLTIVEAGIKSLPCTAGKPIIPLAGDCSKND